VQRRVGSRLGVAMADRCFSARARVAGAGARRHARADAPYGSVVDEAHVRPSGGGAGLGWEQRCGKRERLGRALGLDPRAQTHESRALCPRDPGRIRPPHAASHSVGAWAGPADAAQLRGGQVPAQSRARCVNCSVGRSASLCSRGGSACVWRVMPRVPVHRTPAGVDMSGVRLRQRIWLAVDSFALYIYISVCCMLCRGSCVLCWCLGSPCHVRAFVVCSCCWQSSAQAHGHGHVPKGCVSSGGCHSGAPPRHWQARYRPGHCRGAHQRSRAHFRCCRGR